jgi:DNA processing protein
MEVKEKKYWLGFSAFAEIGPVRFKLLKDYFGSAEGAFNASEKHLKETGLSEKIIKNFLDFRRSFDFTSYLVRLDQLGITTLTYDEEHYPKLLNNIDDKPIILYLKTKNKNNFEIFNQKMIGVVGTRKITHYGRQSTEMITKDLVEKGFVIVSGLARGVDRVAHETAISSNGLTIAVLGCGLEIVYPPEHKQLAEKIIGSGGMLVSEFPPGTPMSAKNFPLRNRIISGLSLGVVVTEAAEKSGSLITASRAAEQGREVFAVPGPINSSLSDGTACLIKKGAKLVNNISDIIEELNVS